MNEMRSKWSKIVVGGIIGFIAFVFVVSGVFGPSKFRGLHEGTVAGAVNGDVITLGEFNRELERRMEFFKNLGGGNLTESQLAALNLKEAVFNELVNRKLMVQEARRSGMQPSAEEIRAKIREIPAFQKDGKFDPQTYRQVLQANNYSPGVFERLIREDLSLQGWNSYFRDRVRVSDEEIKNDFLASKDKRNIKYVLLTTDTAAKAIKVSPKEIESFLKDQAKVNLAKNQYEARKSGAYKGMTFDQAKEKIASEILASQKTDEVRKLNERLASEVAGMLSADKASDARVNAHLKAYGVEVKSTGLITRSTRFIPGVGEAPELLDDAFAAKSPINPKDGGKAKSYNSANWWLVGVVSETQIPDLSKLDSEKDQIRAQLMQRKERQLFDSWLEKLSKGASIKRNEDVVGTRKG